MATKEEIKKAILKVAGNPEAGAIFQLADAMAEAIVGLDAPVRSAAPSYEPTKETRVLKADEKR
jgi:hypothetical protein